MEKSFCRLLIFVNHALVANFKRRKDVFYRISQKGNFSRKIPDLQY